MQRQRTTAGIDQRLDQAVRAYDGRYEPEKLALIRRTRGSEVYVKLVAAKCRGVSALLRDVYLSGERPWQINPTPWPKLPDNIEEQVRTLVQSEMQLAGPQGAPMLVERMAQIRNAAYRAARERSKRDAVQASRKLDDLLTEGGFYTALSDLITDLPIYPYAVMKGPTVESKLGVTWGPDGKAVEASKPVLTWRRVSPYDFWWSPGVERVQDGDTAERIIIPRYKLAAMRDIPGWDANAISTLLADSYAGVSRRSWFFGFDQNRKNRENRDWDEDPNLFELMCWHGWLQGDCLIAQNLDPAAVGLGSIRPTGIYLCEVWLAGDLALRTRVVPWPAPTPPYYCCSFEKVPGSVAGHGLHDLLKDVADIINATARSLCNNMAMASGPQIGVNADALPPGEDPTVMEPWHVWLLSMQGNQGVPPISFFQPNSNAAELLGVYKELMNMADEVSSIPRYQLGSERTGGGAGRTASGLAMLMTNASKGLQQVAKNVDETIDALLQRLYNIVLLTDVDGILRGDEEIVAQGAAAAQQLETDRQRQLEFLQATNNPVDLQITGIGGRATVLRSVAGTIGLDEDRVVPDDEELKSQQANTGVPGTPQPLPQGPGPLPGVPTQGSFGTPPGAPGGAPGAAPSPAAGAGPRTNIVQPAAAPAG
jgi:hypothetical protein